MKHWSLHPRQRLVLWSISIDELAILRRSAAIALCRVIDSKGRIGEPDTVICGHNYIVRTVQLFALVEAYQNFPGSIIVLPYNRPLSVRGRDDSSLHIESVTILKMRRFNPWPRRFAVRPDHYLIRFDITPEKAAIAKT